MCTLERVNCVRRAMHIHQEGRKSNVLIIFNKNISFHCLRNYLHNLINLFFLTRKKIIRKSCTVKTQTHRVAFNAFRCTRVRVNVANSLQQFVCAIFLIFLSNILESQNEELCEKCRGNGKRERRRNSIFICIIHTCIVCMIHEPE